MPYTTEDGGRLNNFANEPKMYQAEPPSAAQKRTYLIQGVVGAVLIVGSVAVAYWVSSVG